ncbi:MAG: HDOD domain-containing protein [Tepidisphaerales bacterium]
MAAEPGLDLLKEKRVELVLQQLEELPTLPAVAVRVLEATSSESTSARDVVSLIASDPALTTRVLKLVHRADLGVRAEVNSVERAVVLLGFEAVRSAVLAVSLFDTFPAETRDGAESAPARGGAAGGERRNEGSGERSMAGGGGGGGGGFSREGFWRHSIAVASCCELLAAALRGTWGKDVRVEPAEAFVCGLLHDIGKVALDSCLPKSFAKVVEATELLRGNIADLERQIIGLDHMVVGKRLAEKWKLPVAIRDCIWLHGQSPAALPATVRNARLVSLVTLADQLVREQHLGYSGNYAGFVPKPALLDAVGMREAQAVEVAGRLVETLEKRASALGLGEMSTAELYRQALSQANRELGRMSTQLAVRNRKLAVRAKFFDALAEFHGALRADAAPGLVLRAIAQTACEALDTRSAAAFSIPPGQPYAEVVLVHRVSAEAGTEGGEGLESETLLCEVQRRPELPPGGAGVVASAGDELGFVVGEVAPRLGGGRRYWVALSAEGACIGGVVWSGGRDPVGGAGGSEASGSVEDEAERLAGMRVELSGLASGWSLALRTSQIRDEARLLAEQLAEANRNLQDAQSQLLRARTLTSIAEMAAGAAHEMNNPLAVISGRSQLLASTLTDEKSRKNAALIAEQCHRLSGMITELMEFAKPQPPKVQTCSVAEIVEAAVRLAKGREGMADRRIDVLGTDAPAVRVDKDQAAAALAEVLDNALQATDRGPGASPGTVKVAAAHDPFGGHVVVTVTDDGCGMDEHTLARAFDPFFSAKPAGRRRGMGLARALRWLESVGGSIRLDSKVNAGTRALVLLPADTSASQQATASTGTGGAGVARRVAG